MRSLRDSAPNAHQIPHQRFASHIYDHSRPTTNQGCGTGKLVCGIGPSTRDAALLREDWLARTPGGFDGLALVGRFRPDWRGVMDLAGNVWEWVEDDFGGSDEKTKAFGASRGGAWTTGDRMQLLASYRNAIPAVTRAPDVGFRVVLSTERPARDDD